MTKKEELTAYKIMLKSIKNNIFYKYGFCNITSSEFLPNFIEENYPELFKLKPVIGYLYATAGGINHRNFWWNPDTTKIRIKALKFVIESLKNKTDD